MKKVIISMVLACACAVSMGDAEAGLFHNKSETAQALLAYPNAIADVTSWETVVDQLITANPTSASALKKIKEVFYRLKRQEKLTGLHSISHSLDRANSVITTLTLSVSDALKQQVQTMWAAKVNQPITGTNTVVNGVYTLANTLYNKIIAAPAAVQGVATSGAVTPAATYYSPAPVNTAPAQQQGGFNI